MGYKNNDGLYNEYGTARATPTTGGEYRNDGQLREIELKLTLSDLTASEVIQSDTIFVPAGVRIQEVEVITQTAGATGTAIDLGLIRTDRSTEIDYDGLLAAMPIAAFNSDGERTIYTAVTTVPSGATGTGALIGTTLSNVGYITASRTDSTAFTAGVLIVKIRYFKP